MLRFPCVMACLLRLLCTPWGVGPEGLKRLPSLPAGVVVGTIGVNQDTWVSPGLAGPKPKRIAILDWAPRPSLSAGSCLPASEPIRPGSRSITPEEVQAGGDTCRAFPAQMCGTRPAHCGGSAILFARPESLARLGF